MKARFHIASMVVLSAIFVATGVVLSDKPESLKKEGKAEERESSVEKGKIVKSDEEWRKQLTEEQFLVTRKAGTERPFGEAYNLFKKHGEGRYSCVCCGTELFSSNEKFNSGCGWPSFYDPSKPHNVVEKKDNKHGMERTEVVCGKCDAHLGHVFMGEGFDTPTDKRYCINMASLKFSEGGEKKAVEKKEEKESSVEDADEKKD